MFTLVRIVTILCLVAPLNAVAAEKSGKQLVFNNVTNSPFTTPQGTGYLDRIYKELFQRLGYSIKLIHLPAERALRSANEGIIDGDISRIKGLDKLYPNLLRVPETVVTMNFVAFIREPVSQPASWDALKTLEVGYIKGWKIFEANVPPETSLLALRDHIQLFEMINRDRLQVVLYSQYLGMAYLKKRKFENIYPWMPPLVSKEMFLYVHKQHKQLIPLIVMTLRDMKKEGFVTQVYNETIMSVEK